MEENRCADRKVEEFRLQVAVAALQALRKGARSQFIRLGKRLPKELNLIDSSRPLPEIERELLEFIKKVAEEDIGGG